MLDDIAPLIWEVVGEDHITTREVNERLDSIFQYRCPDDMAKTLNRLKRKGLIKGEVSIEKGGWVWWVDKECREKKDD